MPSCYIKDYPRPQFVRKDWQNLNGEWDFAFDDGNEGEKKRWYADFYAQRKIIVPFTYETPASGIGEEKFHPVVWYSRTFQTKAEPGKRVHLHFEGSDFVTKAWVNGVMVGTHTGGYTRFTFDITDALTEGVNTLVVRVQDSDDLMQPRGKQRWKGENFGCWYVQTTGIWKPVWLETVSVDHIARIKMTPNLQDRLLRLDWTVDAAQYGPDLSLEAEVSFKGTFVNRVTIPVMDKRGRIDIDVASRNVHEWGLMAWMPWEPNLYDITFRLLRDGKELDNAGSYFGMREIRIEDGQVLLNGTPLYQRLILDQGYWKDSHLTPPDEEAIITDIDRILELGFNGARKHQKVEDERYAYWCDVKGMLMWCEMPSPYLFGDDMVKNFTAEWMEVVEQNYNHPAIITWTPFNESWGVPEIKTDVLQQQFTEAIYHLTKSMDIMRPVITNDGWEHTISDIITLHDYEELGELLFARYDGNKDEVMDNEIYTSTGHRSTMAGDYLYDGQPVIITEYGGAAFSGDDSTWGYGNKVDSKEKYLARYDDITCAVKRLPWVCGYCYTQVSDVQQEVNGLMDIDRNYKADYKAIRETNLKDEKTLQSK
ncbi:MAG: glycoside hydrolase family 2 protein [Oscillospiraceae bacterium]